MTVSSKHNYYQLALLVLLLFMVLLKAKQMLQGNTTLLKGKPRISHLVAVGCFAP